MTTQRVFVRGCGIAVAVVGAAAAAVAGGPERQDQPQGTPATRLSRPAFPGDAGFPDLPLIVQVNVNSGGMNIVGDAANEPSIAVDPRAPNRVAIGWRQFDTIASNFRQAGNGWSNDGGRTWHNNPVFTPGTFRSDPVLRAMPDGTIVYHSLRTTFDPDIFTTTDGGRTWAGPTPVVGGDKTWMAIDNSMSTGRGNIYLAWNTAGNNYAPNTFARGVDFFFDPPITIPQSPIFGTVDVGANGDLYVFGARTGSSPFFFDKSTTARNPGIPTVTFVPAVQVNLGGSMSSGGPNPDGLLGQAWIGADRSNGNIYALCSVNPTGADPLDVMFSRSTDGGATWSAPVRVNTDPPGANAWQWFGTMGVAPNGRIDVVWLDTRESQVSTMVRLYYASSSDAGMTWTPNTAISPQFNAALGYPNQNKIGDYYDIVSDKVGAHVAWAATFTGGQDVYYTRINDYDCNGNGIPDGVELAMGTGQDCNMNGALDSCDIASGFSLDEDHDGVPDECELASCPGDTNGDNIVNFADLNIVLGQFGQSGPGLNGDVNHDGTVNFADLNIVLSNFGLIC